MSNMDTVVEEIGRAASALQIAQEKLRLLSPDEGKGVYLSALEYFVAGGDRRWWWESFRSPGVTKRFEAGDGWRQLLRVVPDPSATVWFIAEDVQLPYYPVYETTTEIAVQVIGECYGFEYYLIAKDFSWLLCETHHNNVCAIGEVECRLALA